MPRSAAIIPSLLLAVSIVSPAVARQVVFHDDFDGDSLRSHWQLPPVEDWAYDVSDGMLNVTSLYYPSHPKSPDNFAAIGTLLDVPLADFRIDVWMGWETGPGPHRLRLEALGPQIGVFGYTFGEGFSTDPAIQAGAGNEPSVTRLAPPDGVHQFSIIRTGIQFDFLLDGMHFASFIDHFGIPLGALGIEFVGPYPGEFGTLHVDRVDIVPAPTGMGLLVLALFAVARRRSAGREVAGSGSPYPSKF